MQVAAWRTRGRVPLGVDSTACLVAACQRDAAAANAAAATSAAATAGNLQAQPTTASSPAAAAALGTSNQQQHLPQAFASESELRLQYGMAVVRMVNGIADSSQRGRVAASVASLASQAGLPPILVDLRHEATHNELPSLAALRWVGGLAGWQAGRLAHNQTARLRRQPVQPGDQPTQPGEIACSIFASIEDAATT